MQKPTLYIFVGYPGAGKTSVARIIHKKTGAVHIWADHERRDFFGRPTYSPEENLELYQRLNDQTARLLRDGQSVLFDTNFNFCVDRQKLRRIADDNHAATVLIWVDTPLEIARKRAVEGFEHTGNRVLGKMTSNEFEANVNKLEPPTKDEKYIKINGTKLDAKEIIGQLSL